MTFRKRTARGKPFCKKVFRRTPFPKTPKRLRSGHEPATESLTRTRPEEAYLGVLCGGTGGRLSCKKEPPGLPAEQKSICMRIILIGAEQIGDRIERKNQE